MTFGAFISAKRKELRLTLRETAKHLGIACGYLSDVEQSRRPAPEGDFVERILVDVSKEVYRAYYSIERHTRTLDEKDIRNGKVLYSDLDTDELLGEDMIPDMTSERVEDSAIYSILREKLHQYLGMLPPQDMELIQALYFECMTEREYAQQIGISQKGVNKRRQKVLDKLRTMMKAK